MWKAWQIYSNDEMEFSNFYRGKQTTAKQLGHNSTKYPDESQKSDDVHYLLQQLVSLPRIIKLSHNYTFVTWYDR